ncbi:Zinc finger fyve domain-containing 24 [Hyphodiscus hymeniophilus]|uniref:Zinc finger fyve domain-containing 24 n=1 Tax=Hyphodiscus hymeniophilus TaxID=353542 RepID=A0A9P6VNF9_9HELO|nr:Zinc finger fyve domain-containing 24 [Hyphodiscus hymeniophilus]
MSTPEHAAVAASAAQPDSSHDLLGLGDLSSSREGHASEQSEVRRHNRHISDTSSVYFDTVDSAEPPFGIPDETEARDQSDSRLEEDSVRTKGKETSRTESDQRNAGSGISAMSQSSSGVFLEGGVHDVQSTTAESDRTEHPGQPKPTNEIHNMESQKPEVQDNTSPSSTFFGDSTRTRMPATRVPSFGAPVNIEEDRRNWERIQEIAGPSRGRNNSVPGGPPSRPDFAAHAPQRVTQKRKSISGDHTRGLDGSRPSGSEGYSGNSRPPPYSESFSPARNNSQASLARQNDPQSNQEVVLPRWQPDAEVTFCPICATQFSFFVRKHHCRKCGRVVCNACSPHRITIPYQFIVQPPKENGTLNDTSSHARPPLDPARVGSSSAFDGLGGGERVRLCNPCVPDPNTAPPQTPQFANHAQRIPGIAHSRSASSTNTYTTSPPPIFSSSNPSLSLSEFLQNRPCPAAESVKTRIPLDPQYPEPCQLGYLELSLRPDPLEVEVLFPTFHALNIRPHHYLEFHDRSVSQKKMNAQSVTESSPPVNFQTPKR